MPFINFVTNPKGHCRLCQGEDTEEATMVSCNECERLFHLVCVKLSRKPNEKEFWDCPKCHKIKYERKRLEAQVEELTKACRTPAGQQDDKQGNESREEKGEHSKSSNDKIKNPILNESSAEFSLLKGLLEAQEKGPMGTMLKRQALAQLPKFGGNPKEWPIFKRTYDDTTREGAFTNLENLNSTFNPPQRGNVNFHERSAKRSEERRNDKGRPTKQQVNKGAQQSENQPCPICERPHSITKCETFRGKIPKERVATALNLGLCYKCLMKGHRVRDCKSRTACTVDGCKYNHHSMLHIPKNDSIETQVAPVNNHSAFTNKSTYYQVLPVTLINGIHKVKTYAFLDTGSSLTLMEENIAKQLELKGKKVPLSLKWTQEFTTDCHESQQVSLRIRGNSKKYYKLTNVRTVPNLSLPRQVMDYENLAERYQHLQGLPIEEFSVDHNQLLAGTKHRIGRPGEPIATKTKLGWIIY
uniref:PHD-type domain-containing protein n=1 Tax=Anopheles epiroticus TaxID=199890 RepID=A0A182PX85_9DIPT